jgi:RES domain-containing protein
MIVVALGPNAPFYRALSPRWAHTPESGRGSAEFGGRFNRPGVEARYLALTPETALREYQGESALLPPATITTFLVSSPRIVDFSRGYDAATWSPIWQEADCNWKRLAFFDRIEPPSWVIGDIVREAGHAGILYRSVRHADGTCLVLFPDQALATSTQAPVHDPGKLLPRDQSSWR